MKNKYKFIYCSSVYTKICNIILYSFYLCGTNKKKKLRRTSNMLASYSIWSVLPMMEKLYPLTPRSTPCNICLFFFYPFILFFFSIFPIIRATRLRYSKRRTNLSFYRPMYFVLLDRTTATQSSLYRMMCVYNTIKYINFYWYRSIYV